MTSTTDRADESAAALARYRNSMRRGRTVYFSVIGVVVVALAIGVGIAWSRGEVAHTSLQTVNAAPATLPVQAPSQRPQPAWHTTDRAAIGVPQWGGTVVTWSTHTVRGLDARTGAQTWSYTRSNRTLCTAAQTGGTTLALYAVGGNCDELTALDSQTGARRFTRTLDKDGMPVDGTPAYQALPDTFMVTTSSVIYAIDPVTGFDRWTYQHQGCTIGHVVLGTVGALISQVCTTPRCGTLKFCGRGPQLLLRHPTAGRDDKSTTNPDKITWNQIGDTDIPVSADGVISAFNTATRSIDTLNDRTGRPGVAVSLSPIPSTFTSIVAVASDGRELVWIDGVTYLIDPAGESSLWSRSTLGPPTVPATDVTTPAAAGRSGVTVASATGVELLRGDTGVPSQTFPVAQAPRGALVHPLGAGFLVESGSGAVAYR